MLGVMRWLALLCAVGCGRSATASDAGSDHDDGSIGASDTGGSVDSRDRLLRSYLAFLRADPSVTQSNGLSGANLADVCALWSALQPAAQQTFLTITARLGGSKLADGSAMLDHVTTLYRVVGGDGATQTDPGSCGGGEFNRMIMAMDLTLHDALVAANDHKGGAGDLADVPAGGFWRDSHDLGGAHAPFDTSDETEGGAPRGQVQYFRDPASPLAKAALGRMDLAQLVEPLALEADQDYDCTHNSNPGCDYTFYGPACVPEATKSGVDIYVDSYGSYEPDWKPAGC